MPKSTPKKKRNTRRGPRKGGQFERETSVKLSLWVSHGKRKDVYWRSAMSGGRATVFKKRGEDLKHQAGDIVAVHPMGHALTNRFFIETKHYRDLQIDSFFLKQTGNLWKFWQKACKQAKSHKLIPLMIAKQNSMPTILLVNGIALTEIATYCDCVRIRGGNPPNVYLFDEVLKTRFIGNRPVPKQRLSKKEIEEIAEGSD